MSGAPCNRCKVKLLLDQNLSHRLCARLADLGVTAVHVRSVGLEAVDDARVWDYAAEHEFMIVSKDADFNNRAFLFGCRRSVADTRVDRK